jgi:hypothetical protein
MKTIFLICLMAINGVGEKTPASNKSAVDNNPDKKETCDFLLSSTERSTKKLIYQGGDIYVYNPSTICDRSTTVFSIRSIKVNGLKIDFKMDISENNLRIPLSELNLKMGSEVKVDLYHYSFSRPEFLSN